MDIHGGTHHCVERSTRSEIDEAQERDDHVDAELCVEWRAKAGMYASPAWIGQFKMLLPSRGKP